MLKDGPFSVKHEVLNNRKGVNFSCLIDGCTLGFNWLK